MATRQGDAVTCLIVPGLNGSGEQHWQTLWERERSDCVRVEMGCWSRPVRTVWISRLEQAVLCTAEPIVIVAHSLGCLATAWWSTLSDPSITARVRGALLVAPPDVEKHGPHRVLKRFAPEPDTPLPFPSLLVASRNDPYASFERQAEMARRWHSELIDVGACGHINAESGLDDWIDGQTLLDELIERTCPAQPVEPTHRHEGSGRRDRA
ncbi:RBBP9/YdeN family alpha/beta hydrolase [Flavisphingomonas formosensis]|uniref:RBBP9/YdeN family alpha/beta hydrolase n=1 Tax=Flavisphingomonas formosensis TaxID=861534 RepID=UPI0012F90832|nr:alpha/beta hydrolase [Sphingomonas formosensis]